MSDRDTLLKIFKIMRRLLLVSYDPVGPIPRKGTTRHECYRALYEIQNLLHTNMFFATLPPQTNADRIRAMSDEELAKQIADWNSGDCPVVGDCMPVAQNSVTCEPWKCWLDWLKSPVEEGET